MPSSRSIVAACAALVAALALAPAAARADDPPDPMFGVNVNRVFNDDFWQTHWDERLSAVHAAGIGLARSDAFWDWAEPNPPANGVHTYDWGITDSVAQALAEHGLRWLPILDYSAPWATSVPGDTHAPPTSNEDYAAYAGAFAARFGRGGSFWRDNPLVPYSPVTTYEIWNEPDLGWFWKPAPDAARYADMYLRARAAIHAADPAARVLIGGLASGGSYVTAMYAARPELAVQVDGIAFHPYATTVDGVLDRVRSMRRTLDALGASSLPLYLTELGWPTAGASGLVVPDGQRAADIEQATDALARSDCGIAAVLPYTWTTPEDDVSNSDEWYGLWHWTGGMTAAGDAYARVVARWQSEPPVDASRQTICHPPDFDGDGVPDVQDPDLDGDGVPNAADAFPRDAREWADSDRDGVGDNADPDDDNDGVIDARDAFPRDAREWVDSDGDGIGDRADRDDDNDGVSDAAERRHHSRPLDADTDDDGLSDGTELKRGTDPRRADSDHDGLPDGLELGVTHGVADPPGRAAGTRRSRVRRDRDRDPRSRTSPRRRDSDGDGVSDGREDRNRNGRRDRHETDPRARDSDRDGIGDRWDRRPLQR